MKILGINASPRKGANTQTLVEAALAGVHGKGAQTRLVHLRELELHGCVGCEGCKQHLGRCVQKDDLSSLLQEMTAWDGFVIGTPVYWFHVCAQFKMLVDRLYSFIEMNEDPRTGTPAIRSAFPQGKRALFLVSRGDPEEPVFFPQFYRYLEEWMHLIPFTLGSERYEFIHQYGTGTDRTAAAGDAALLERVKTAGAALVSAA